MFTRTISMRWRRAAATRTLALSFLLMLWPASEGFGQGPLSALARIPGRLRAELELQGRAFPKSPADPRQQQHGTSIALRAEYDVDWANGDQLFEVEPFFRYDPSDPRRTHFDFRVLSWTLIRDWWELRLGFRTVYWGVTESQHLVDIINQTDLVEGPDGEEKLGQPMANLALILDWGTLEFFVMPFFRERTFPGVNGRLRFLPLVDPDFAIYESGAGRNHVDWAIRWFHTIGSWDIGLSHFNGTSREPLLVPQQRGGEIVLAPFYPLINQTGLDLQMTGEAWLWKLEAITRSGFGDRYIAFTGGFERTLVGVFGSSTDLGLLAEYLYDSRGLKATTPFQNDLFLGTRLAFNDVQGSELLTGAIIDLESGARGRRFLLSGGTTTCSWVSRVISENRSGPRDWRLKRTEQRPPALSICL
jgi:hypothetical protein